MSKSAIQRIGVLTSYYGGLYVTEDDGKYFWALESHADFMWCEIPKELYVALTDYERARDDG